MFSFDNNKHHFPHIHVSYQDFEAVFSIENDNLIEGAMPTKQRKLVEAWIEIHREELIADCRLQIADWRLAISGQEIFKIDPLR